MNVTSAFFDPESERRHPWFPRLTLGILYLLGIFLWGMFFEWGRINFRYADWAYVTAPRLYFIQDAIQKGVFPLHMPDGSALQNVSDRYLAVPDAAFSPQMLLLGIMSIGRFIFVDVVLFYTLGTLGLLIFRQKFRISVAAFVPLFIIFNFNGYIESHLSVGHIGWVSYFLFPWLFVLLFHYLDNGPGWLWLTGIVVLLFTVLLQGGFHHYVWLLLFLGLFLLSRSFPLRGWWQRTRWIILALLLSGLVGAARLFPAIMDAGKFQKEFLAGYPTLNDLWTSLVLLKTPSTAYIIPFGEKYIVGWWEYDFYLGLLGALFLLYFGLIRSFRKEGSIDRYKWLWAPVFVLTLFSIGNIYQLVTTIGFPLLSAERVTTRFITLPLVFLMMAAAVSFQDWLYEHPRSGLLRYGFLAGCIMTSYELWNHFQGWRVRNAGAIFRYVDVDFSIKFVSNHADPVYVAVLAAGSIIIAATFIILSVLVLALSRRKKKSLEKLASEPV